MGINVGDYLELYIYQTIEDSQGDLLDDGYSQEQVLYKSTAPEYGDRTIYTGFSRHPEWHLTAKANREFVYGWSNPGYMFKDEVW